MPTNDLLVNASRFLASSLEFRDKAGGDGSDGLLAMYRRRAQEENDAAIATAMVSAAISLSLIARHLDLLTNTVSMSEDGEYAITTTSLAPPF